MNSRHAPQRGDPRARRIAQVKFVALTLDDDMVMPAEGSDRPSLFTQLRELVIRVIGRLEAARP